MVDLMDAALLPDDHPALVPDLWARAMLGHPRVTPQARVAALQAAKLPTILPSGSTLKLTQAHEALMLDVLADQLDDPAFGARAGIEHDPHMGSIVSYMAFAASTLREMLELLERYVPITRAWSRVSVDETGLGATVELGFGDKTLSGLEQFGEFALGSILATIRGGVGVNVPIDWISVACPDRLAPGVLETIYRGKIYRNVQKFAIALPQEALAMPLRSSDGQLLQHLTAYGDILLDRRRTLGSSVLEEVEAKVVARLSFGAPSQAEVADQLGISARTLARRLEREGHSFREVLERLRYDLARSYLADPRLPLAEIAFLLGFADQSSFGTAFLRWSGFTPGHYRRTL